MLYFNYEQLFVHFKDFFLNSRLFTLCTFQCVHCDFPCFIQSVYQGRTLGRTSSSCGGMCQTVTECSLVHHWGFRRCCHGCWVEGSHGCWVEGFHGWLVEGFHGSWVEGLHGCWVEGFHGCEGLISYNMKWLYKFE